MTRLRDVREEPPRLIEDPELRPLIERANAEFLAPLDEPAAFRRLSDRLSARERRDTFPKRTALAGALAFAGGLALLLGRSEPELPSVLLSPEISRAAPRELGPAERAPSDSPISRDGTSREARQGDTAPRAAGRGGWSSSEPIEGRDLDDTRRPPRPARSTSDSAQAAPIDERPVKPAQRSVPADNAPSRDRAEAAERRRSNDALAEPHAGSSAPPSAATAREESGAVAALGGVSEDCLALARNGPAQAAERCFAARAAGGGLGAEMALYELARLRRDVLGDARGALAAASEYRARFPNGSLRNEVDISRVELLADLDQGRQALDESAALLASPGGRERAAELHLLRGNIYRNTLKNPKLAAAEYGKAAASGGRLGAEASRLLGACLEALGDEQGAIAAYQRYLAIPGQPRADEVKQHIDALTAGAPRERTAP